MTILNKNIAIVLLICFCVLSINTKAESNSCKKINSIDGNVEVNFTKPSSTGLQDASIVVTIKGNVGAIKVIAVSNTSLGTITKEGTGSKLVLSGLYAGFYKLYIIDSKNTTTEYQITID